MGGAGIYSIGTVAGMLGVPVATLRAWHDRYGVIEPDRSAGGFLFAGTELGEPGLVATMQENPTQLARIAAGFGWSLEERNIHVMYRTPVDLYIDQWVYDLLGTIERTKRGGS